MAGGVIRLSPARSKTLVGRILFSSPPIAEALARRRARRDGRRVVEGRAWQARQAASSGEGHPAGPATTDVGALLADGAFF